jgi:hypothetical protein
MIAIAIRNLRSWLQQLNDALKDEGIKELYERNYHEVFAVKEG